MNIISVGLSRRKQPRKREILTIRPIVIVTTTTVPSNLAKGHIADRRHRRTGIHTDFARPVTARGGESTCPLCAVDRRAMCANGRRVQPVIRRYVSTNGYTCLFQRAPSRGHLDPILYTAAWARKSARKRHLDRFPGYCRVPSTPTRRPRYVRHLTASMHCVRTMRSNRMCAALLALAIRRR